MAAYFQRENARKYKHFGGRAVFHCIVNCSTPFILDTPDESSRAGCVMLGVFYCSEKGQVDLCQYFGQKKSKDYAAFLSSSSSFCCGVK